MEPRELSVADARIALDRRALSGVELMRSFLDRIAEAEPAANAFVHLQPPETLLAQAAEADARRDGRAAGLLHGIPIALKANFQCAGMPTSAGSAILRDWVPTEDAAAVTRIRAAGAIVLGMTNMHEFANGPTGHNPHFGTPTNPWDAERVPGGSSSGSAVALARDMCALATGSDTGGSIRVPCAFNGLVGIKPTLGLVNTQGVIPFSQTLDHIGPMARTVADASILLSVLTGSPALAPPPPQAARESLPLEGITVAVDSSYFTTLGEPALLERFDAAVQRLEMLGAAIRDVELRAVHASLAAEVAILFPEAAVVHERWLNECPEKYGDDVRESLLSGRRYAAVEYVRAQEARAAIRDEIDSVLRSVDLLATPTTVIEAPRLDQQTLSLNGQELNALEGIVRCTAPFNLSGHPALTVPYGLGAGGTPLGLQLIGRRLSEALLLHVAEAVEASHEERMRAPAAV
jgi:aspartyl-tRNA(Asn)/glutamyl-tRNA(Gln) amidotransferase subunit A